MAHAAPPAPAAAPRQHALDGLRAVAALSVVGYHAWLYTLPTVSSAERGGTSDYVWHELRLGLVLFFVLSGFLLYGPWVRSAATGGRAPSVRGYAIRRAGRILPAYWVAIAASVLLLWWYDRTPGVRLPDGGNLWLFAVFGQNFRADTLLTLNPPSWTLAVEATFYLALPLLGLLALRGRRAGVVLAPVLFLLAGVAYNYAMSSRGGLSPIVSKVLPAYTPYFGVGMLAAVLAYGRTLAPRVGWALLGAGVVLVVGDALWAADAATRGSHDQALRIWRDLPAATGFALVLLAVTTAVRAPRLLTARPVVRVGELSYGIYLWHVPLLLFLRAQGVLPLFTTGALAVILPLTFLVAAASWRFVEQPAQAWSRRVASRGAGARDPGTAEAALAGAGAG
ncbi:acyltransferase [Paraconexibacter antarcticus]|uniref:Acyltransferase n=1 Tax=Paraconexibacter antarcticus TaxID=2949664 RepID=A0ABY5DP11_9ACTN|nr:acyltransferase [Paraconexibacter antarcticus]UTI62547.1 acyltransferase [Paraconexibacter antarcticus]